MSEGSGSLPSPAPSPSPSIPSPGFERLDTLVRVTTIQSWVYLGLLFAVGTAAVAFAILYRVPTKVMGEGILLIEQDTIAQVRAQATGRLVSLQVKLGDRVEPGKVIGEISQEDLKDSIMEAESKLADLVEEDSDLTKLELIEKKTHENAMEQVVIATGQERKTSGEKLRIAEHMVDGTDRLRMQYSLSDQELLEAREKKFTFQNDLNKTNTRIADLNLEGTKAENVRRRAQRERRLKIKQLERKLELDRDKMTRTSKVVSRFSGTVAQIFCAHDELVKEGGPVVLLHSPKTEHELDDAGKEYDSIVFVPAGEGKKVNSGDVVEVSPTTVKREEHGFIRGEVVAVSELPATKLAMESALQHPELVASFLKRHESSVLLRVHIKLKETDAGDLAAESRSGSDSSTENNRFVWSSSSGRLQRLKTGTMCQAAIVVERRRLISLVLPWTQRIMSGAEPGQRIE
jgi:HlyD family secretion protein